jgi:serine-type D-Ala-D-Ala carboxypeptidase (penicillin-binding protein 5/6)
MRIVVAALLTLTTTPAIARIPDIESAAPVAYLLDMQSGEVLFDRDSTRKIPTASMAKMMTALVAFDALEKKQITLATRFPMKPETWQKWNNQGSTMFLRANENVSVDKLLHGILTLSGNDASVVFAEGFAGSEVKFAGQMNRKATAMGLVDSHFGTANGWPDEGKTYSTARDLSTIAEHIIARHPVLFKSYFSQSSFTWNGVTQSNRNPLLGAIEGADGMKTGHSDEAGYCLVGTAERDGRRLLMVIAGLPSQEARLQEARAIINWGFDAWQSKPLYQAGAKVGEVPVQLGEVRKISVVAQRNIGATYAKGDQPPVRTTIRFKGPIKAPLKKGVQVAELVMHYADGHKQTAPLISAQLVSQTGFWGRAWNGVQTAVGL